MPRRPRRNHTAVFKSKVALAAIKGDKTVVELSQLIEAANSVCERSGNRPELVVLRRLSVS